MSRLNAHLRRLLPNSLYIRLILIFHLLLLPIAVSGIALYYWGKNNGEEQISSSMIAQSNYYLNRFTDQLDSILIQFNNGLDETLIDLWKGRHIISNYERYVAVTKFHNKLFAIKSNSDDLRDVAAYIPGYGMVSANRGFKDMEDHEWNRIDADITFPYFFERSQGTVTFNYLVFHQMIRTDFVKMTAAFDLGALQNELRSHNQESTESLFLLQPDTIAISNGEVRISNAIADKVQGLGQESATTDSFKMYIDDEEYLLAYAYSPKYHLYYIKYVPADSLFGVLQGIERLLIVYIVVLLFVALFFLLYAYKTVREPLSKFVTAFESLENGNTRVTFHYDRSDEFGYLFRMFEKMSRRLERMIELHYNQKLMLKEAELRQLQLKVNPHFLYNCFFMINSMTREREYEKLTVFSSKLSSYYRYISGSGKEKSQLSKELQHAKDYADIQSVRFMRRISRIDFRPLPEGCEQITVPKLILQPIVENAFKHGIKNKMQDCVITVENAITGNQLLVSVEDNGGMIDGAEAARIQSLLTDGDGTECSGLFNIHQRLQLMYDGRAGLSIDKNRENGLKVIIKIPLDGRVLAHDQSVSRG